MLREILRRARRLHRLLWVDERVSALEEHNRNQTEALRKKDEMLRVQFDTLEKHNEALQKQIESLKESLQKPDRLIQRQLDRSEDELEALKSSLEVPDELIGEFQAWKAHNPIPDSPLVTVVVSTHNRAEILAERCIPSILNQTYEKLELVVVGDNCTDGTEEVVRSIKDPRLRFVNLSEREAYPEDPMHRWMVAGTPALNEGLSMSNGDYITHLDDDDEYTLERLENLVEFAKDNDCDFVWHPFWVGKGNEWILNEARRLSYGQVTTSSVLYRSWFKKIPWDINAYRLNEPGDWNRFRKIKYLNPVTMRYPEPLLKHYRDEVAGLP